MSLNGPGVQRTYFVVSQTNSWKPIVSERETLAAALRCAAAFCEARPDERFCVYEATLMRDTAVSPFRRTKQRVSKAYKPGMP
jgi:hypothetical protein